MGEIATKFAGRVDYFLVYITEAHPIDGWWSELGGTGHESFGTTAYAKSTEQRVASAKKFVTTLGLNAPVLVDSIADELENRYEARPERLYVVQGGRVLWRCGLGPFEYDAPGLDAFLEAHMAN